MNTRNKWFPTPAKFWVSVIVLMCTAIGYGMVQEFNDMKTLSYNIGQLNDSVDRIESNQKEFKEIVDKSNDREPRAVTVPHYVVVNRPIVHHYYHRPYNPIEEFFHSLTHAGR